MDPSVFVDDWKQKRKKLRQMKKYESVSNGGPGVSSVTVVKCPRRTSRHRLGVSTLPALYNRRNSRSIQVLSQLSKGSSCSSDQIKSVAQVSWHSLGHEEDSEAKVVGVCTSDHCPSNNSAMSSMKRGSIIASRGNSTSSTAGGGKNQFFQLSSEILKNMGGYQNDRYKNFLSAANPPPMEEIDVEQGGYSAGAGGATTTTKTSTTTPIVRNCTTPILRIAENGNSYHNLNLDSCDFNKSEDIEDLRGSKVLIYQPNSSESRSTGTSKVSFCPALQTAPLSQCKPMFTESFDRDSKLRFFERQKLLTCRTRIGDICVIFALVGIVIMVVERELVAKAEISAASAMSVILKTFILVSTIFLIFFVVLFHIIEIQIFMLDYGAEDWKVAITWQRILKILRECFICIICPFPGSHLFDWTLSADVIPMRVNVPLDVWLGLPMFLRFYLFGRSLVLHSRQFQDVATRTIAALNQVKVNVKFVLRSQMSERPLTVLVLFTSVFWTVVSWGFMHCEKQATSAASFRIVKVSYPEAFWFIIITFMSIGYGDITPRTHCGRILASITGIVGILMASALITVVTNMMALSKAEKHVNTFMADSHIQYKLKVAAANVLQQTWHIHKHLRLKPDNGNLRLRQRKFLQSITRFKSIKWQLRRLTEESDRLLGVDQIQKRLLSKISDLQDNQIALINYVQEACKRVNNSDLVLTKMNEKLDLFEAYFAKRQQSEASVVL